MEQTFLQSYAADKKSAKKTGATSIFSKHYLHKEPSNPELDGWDGLLDNLMLCISVGVSNNANNHCLLRLGRVFVWTVRTLTKLGENREK